MITTENLRKGLQAIGFQTNDTKEDSIVFTSELQNSNKNLTPFQILELEKALSYNADAVFFRYFEDNRPPLPQVYIYDNSSNKLNNDYTQIHKELWSSCHIPTFIVIENSKIKFFDSRKPVLVHSDGSVYTKEIALIDLDDIAHYATVLEKYNAEKFKNGSFWESEEAHNNYLYGKTAYIDLIDKLKTLRKGYKKSSKISSELFDYVIIITTLIKFLEENGVDSNGDNLASNFFQRSVQCGSFIEILEQNKLVDILEKLSIKFNGGIFDLSNEDKIALRGADLSQIITFFDTKIDSKRQLVLWELYSFKHIPVELISNIYEEFLPVEDKGSVYTPHYLVNFLIDECLPIPTINNSVSYNRKTIDVSCGSGIFLVNCFKRLVEIYKINEYYKTNSFPQNLDITTLQKILGDNIFGVDINKNAVELTKFSLQLALCQMLSPKQIWTELTFQDLGEKNIIQRDFFDFITKDKVDKNFDLVIGNPPFNPPPNQDGTEYKKSEYFNEVIEKYNIKPYSIKDSNVALLFLQLSAKLLQKESGLLCLIQPALPLLHKKDNEVFRQELFSNHNVLQVIDFTTLRRVLFPIATVPTCAIFIENSAKKNDEITHVVIRRTNPSKERLYFEIDAYDVHSVKRENAFLNYAWKSNLFGGYRLFNLVERIILNNGYEKVENVISKAETEQVTNYSLLKIVKEKTFPSFVKSNSLKNYFDKYYSFLVAYIAGTSTRQGIDRPYDVLKSDFLKLPIIGENTLTQADLVLVNDIADYKILEFGNGENADTNKEIQVRTSKKIPNSLVDYSDVYLKAINSVYDVNNKKFRLKAFYNTSACFIMHYEYSNSNDTFKIIKNNNFDLSTLINDKKQTINNKKISLIYSQNQIFIIKPKQLRYWLKSVALLDVDTIIADIINLNLLER
ncbi:MAG TPA: Eco57I restriction-modification methylase domain-containing protein [Bacteroidales bacterium]|nr:Eco57I restriction-modification methylase domain-containing protein [Bacteroidales bacterium]HOR60100.1 Eco57I restriction-modification methylase domain-containing protein [Bacteroidales bacterium]HPL03769.1 Eco57I restriction-modification methylase domain-containing protein [Bacteroidales bacterium]